MSKLCFPVEVLNQHLVVLGKTGAGKSSALRHVIEYLLSAGKRVCIVDPKGDWWGLKSSADGKSAGFPIIAFGDFKEPKATDVPINQKSGKHIAELITNGNRPCIIGFRGWMPNEMREFWIDFASSLFNTNEGELYVVIDEVHNFAPKGKILDPKAGEMLHWTNRILSEGRGIGLTFLIASQRPQKVHNDTLTCCETLVGMRVIHKADRDAIEAWIAGCGDGVHGKEVINNLAQMARGEAYVWSPEVGFGPERVKFPMFQTFDSFAPPQLQKKVITKSWSDVDLDEVKERLATVIEEHKANDPRELKRQIAELQRQVAANTKAATAPANPEHVQKVSEMKSELRKYRAALESAMKIVGRINVDGFKDVAMKPEEISEALQAATNQIAKMAEAKIEKQQRQLERLQADAAKLIQQVDQLTADQDIEVTVEVKHNQPFTVVPQARRAPLSEETVRDTHKSNHSPRTSPPINLPPGERAVLVAAAQYHPQGIERDQLSVLTGYKRSSRDAYIQRLREKGFVDVSGQRIICTDAGTSALPDDFEPLPTGRDLQNYWRQRLPEGERKVIEVLIGHGGQPIPREAIDDATGYKRSSRDAYIQRLSARRLVETVGRGEVKAAEVLFA
jgi:hypothetical protein